MANLAAQNTIDTANTDGNCIYGAEPLGGSPERSANVRFNQMNVEYYWSCLLYTSPSPRDKRQSRMPSSA